MKRFLIGRHWVKKLFLQHNMKSAYITLRWPQSKEDPECFLTLFAQLCRKIKDIVENKNLFQILGQKRFLYARGLNGKLYPNRLTKCDDFDSDVELSSFMYPT